VNESQTFSPDCPTCVKLVVGSGSNPDPDQKGNSDPDLHQNDADLKHCFIGGGGEKWTSNARKGTQPKYLCPLFQCSCDFLPSTEE
jgi:hypothetical protein